MSQIRKLIDVFRFTFLAVALLIAGGCATPVLVAPEAEQSDSFRTVLAGFHIDAREGTVRYALRLEKLKATAGPLFLKIRYQNPANEADSHLEERVWPAAEEQLELSSPPLRALKPNVFYLVTINIFEDLAETEPTDTHETYIFSTIDTHSYGR